MPLSFLTSAHWYNEPDDWSLNETALSVTSKDATDFWQQTYYGFHPDNGHFLGASVDGDFSAEVLFSGDYTTQYDQAGLMLRLDAQHWIKCGIEYSDGVTNFSCVVTKGRSDWSIIQKPLVTGPHSVRLTRVGGAILLHYLDEHSHWQLMRLVDFSVDGPLLLGPMVCSPKRAGFRTIFHKFKLGAVTSDPLHGG
ncbi:DUF1349 domain-containing protein [Cohaesibacter celericrescens]|uniref:DUF1349 domain-containing protein n=1 Tax=Cohaesibacter celericrescens TaxID=2067669 RepID=A0A2N5XKH7_9HYPH|nr:DUF1349 domain-containing protein [Cohaesibacter celericrescens]PLW75021.1 DUF1349 domain-containing protein [Cohaesibacter celericrescens]